MDKKLFYITTTIISVLLVAILVYAYGGTNPAVHGHSEQELQGYEKTELFIGYSENGDDIVSSDDGYVNFNQGQNSNSDVFELVTTGNYGIKIKKPGKIMWDYRQDIMTSGSTGYVFTQSNIGESVYSRNIMSATGGYWDEQDAAGAAIVDANDILTIRLACSSCDITNMNPGTWGTITISWVGDPNA